MLALDAGAGKQELLTKNSESLIGLSEIRLYMTKKLIFYLNY